MFIKHAEFVKAYGNGPFKALKAIDHELLLVKSAKKSTENGLDHC